MRYTITVEFIEEDTRFETPQFIYEFEATNAASGFCYANRYTRRLEDETFYSIEQYSNELQWIEETREKFIEKVMKEEMLFKGARSNLVEGKKYSI